MEENKNIKEFFDTLFEPEELEVLEVLELEKEDDDIINIVIERVGEK